MFDVRSSSASDGTTPYIAGVYQLQRSNREVMPEIELSADLLERIDGHLEEGESREEFIDELLDIYETEGTFGQEGP